MKKDEYVKELKGLFNDVFDEIKNLYMKNKLLPVEMLFRFKDFDHKENVLSNYAGVRLELKEEKINIEVSDDEEKRERREIRRKMR